LLKNIYKSFNLNNIKGLKMIEEKEGLTKKNFFDLMFFFIFAISIIFIFNFTSAGTVIGVVNITNISGGQINATFNLLSNFSNTNFLQINDSGLPYTYNFSISHIAATQNLTGINITLPSGFNFIAGSNGTGNLTNPWAAITAYFSNTSTQLSWNSTSLATWIVNASGQSNYTFIWFNMSGSTTPGKYNMTVRFIYNHTETNSALGYNETNISIFVNDTHAPYLVNPVSSVFKFANLSGTKILNLSVLDNGNLTAGAREYDVQGVNISIYNSSGGLNASYLASNVSGKYWNLSINTNQFSDGIYNLTIVANDTLNNLNVTSFNVTIDNTAPTGTLTCDSSSVSISGIINCTCSPSDSLSGIDPSSYSSSFNPPTGSVGTFSTSCSFADLAGNTGTSNTLSYSVSSINPVVSPSGPSTTTEIPVTNNQLFSKLLPSTPTIVSGFAVDSGVKQIQINVNSEEDNVQIIVDQYNSLPSTISTSKDNTYKYLHVTTQNLISQLKNATMTIQVQNSWISNNGITNNDVALFRYDENLKKWNEIPTIFKSQDSNYSYYDIVLNNFSYFAIASTKVSSVTGNKTTGEQPLITPTKVLGLSYWTWSVIVVSIIIIIVGYILIRKRMIHRKKLGY
jgi:PGF-pre-PGF domain-containing protein